MIRLFIALPIPSTMRVLLHAMGRSLHGARAVPEEQIHLTLRFIGEVETSLLLDIKDQLKQAQFSQFQMNIRGVGHFPPRGKPRVIWAGLDAGDPLIRLKRKIDTSLIQSGIPSEGRKFSPHITIARIKNSSMQRVTDFLAGNAFLEFDRFTAECFHLYSSRLTQKGAVHTLEEIYPLGSVEDTAEY